MRGLVFIVLVIILTSKQSYAQTYEYVPFPTDSAIWSESSCICSGLCGVYDKYILTNEDTTININSYKKLYFFYDSIFNPLNAIYLGGIREDNKRIFYCGINSFYNSSVNYYKPFNNCYPQEILLYDFSLNIGDTLPDDICINTSENNIVVSDVDTIIYDNKPRKVFHFNNLYTTWIEGIGSNRGLLFHTGQDPLCDYWYNELICFMQNESIVYHNNISLDCMPVLIPDKVTENGIMVSMFPNPLNDKLYVELQKNTNDFSISIYNLFGQEVKRERLNQKTNEINISDLSKGIYNIIVMSEKEVSYFKIIKE